MQENRLGPDSPDLADTLFDLAQLRRKQGRIAEGGELYQRASRIDRRIYPAGHPVLSK
jgi:hypothetical protein